jgi:hypothetical protein
MNVLKIFEHDGTVVVHMEGPFSRSFPHVREKYDGLKYLLLILLEFGRLECTLNDEKLANVHRIHDIDGVYNLLRRNTTCESDAPDSSALADP